MLAGLAMLFARDPATSDLFPRCPFHSLTGLHCPGCGTLRAVHRLLHGEVLAALSLNPLALLLLPIAGYALVGELAFASRGKSLPGPTLPASLIWALLALVVLFWILRNFSCYPFELLAPH